MRTWVQCAGLGLLLCCGAGFGAPAAAPEDAGPAAEEGGPPWGITPDPGLPNVLILGDSISMAYTLPVRKLLEGKANVFRPHSPDGSRAENCQGTTFGVQRIDAWLAGRRWDVVHFNWGLHDLKHVDAESGRASTRFEDPRQAEPELYREQLTELVAKLKATGARLIFATTTPYPDGVNPARRPADAALYNGIALEIMKANGIEVNDLYSFCAGRLAELQQPGNVHFTPAGSERLAEQVAGAIQRALPAGRAGTP